jgi:hypothetical protein
VTGAVGDVGISGSRFSVYIVKKVVMIHGDVYIQEADAFTFSNSIF